MREHGGNTMEKDEVRAIAEEVGQQIGEQLGQTLSQTIQKLVQTLGATVSGTSYSRAVEDIGETEVTAKELIGESGIRFANVKRTADEYQNVSLKAIGQDRVHFDKLISDAQEHNEALRNASLIALTNAIENGNLRTKDLLESMAMVAKQAIKHADVAADRIWNPDEQTWAVVEILRDETFKNAIAAMVAAAVAEALKDKQE